MNNLVKIVAAKNRFDAYLYLEVDVNIKYYIMIGFDTYVRYI